ncbi:MAG: Fe-S protein assembly co-chaperone HscB [Planctomycetota bacterium]
MDDPFAVFGLERGFELDAGALRSAMLRLTAQTHPDRYTDPIEQAEAAERSAAINRAYTELKDPERRARVLLRLYGHAIDEKASPPPALLMEVMEVREQMEEAIASKDTAALARLRADAETQRGERLEAIAAAFGRDDLEAVAGQLQGLRYVERMLEQMPG